MGCRIVVSDLSRQLTHAAVKGGDKKHKLPPSHKRLVDDGVTFTKQLTDMPFGQVRNLDDTCGNLIQLQHVNFTG